MADGETPLPGGAQSEPPKPLGEGAQPQAQGSLNSGTPPPAEQAPSGPTQPHPQPSTGNVVRPRGGRLWEFAAAALAVFLYLLIADAAVETILTQSPVQWVVLGTVVGYFIVSAAIWRYLSWSTRAAASLLLLLGLVAGTAWLPGSPGVVQYAGRGLTQGIVMLRQPTSTVLEGVTAGAILLGAVIMAGWRFVPLWGRLGAGLIAMYGLTAVVLGVIKRVPYADLFHGHSEWQRLPFWLQGAFLAAAVLAVTFLVHLIHGLVKVRGHRLRAWGLETAVVALALAVVAAGFALPAARDLNGRSVVLPSPPTPVPAPPGPAGPASPAGPAAPVAQPSGGPAPVPQ